MSQGFSLEDTTMVQWIPIYLLDIVLEFRNHNQVPNEVYCENGTEPQK